MGFKYGNLLMTGLIAGIVSLVAASASAHHSEAAFDRTNPIIVTGDVTKFLWANPHVWIHLNVPNNKGSYDQWVLEGPPIAMMTRNGWNGKSVRPGENVRLLVAPYRDGSKRGEFMALKKTKEGIYLKF